MTFSSPARLALISVATLFMGMNASAQSTSENPNEPDPEHPGRAIYEQNCAVCHANPVDPRAADIRGLTAMTPERIYGAISEGGVMAPMAASLSMDDKIALIGYLTSGQTAESAGDWIAPMMCAPDNRLVSLYGDASFETFGGDTTSPRYVSADDSGLTTADMANLEIAWAIGFPQTTNVSAAPVTVGRTTFVNGGGKLFAFDTVSECAKWVYDGGGSRSPLTFGTIDDREVILYAVGANDVHVVDALSGDLVWKTAAVPQQGSGGRIRSGVILHEDKVLVPLSASGVGGGGTYCCEGHGSVMALNASDGSIVWEYHTMPEATDNGQVNSLGQKLRGPSGAPIWTQPSIDVARNRVLVTTGENTSYPPTNTSDAIISLDLDTGEPAWIFQAMESDLWNMHCRGDDSTAGPNCPWHWDDENIGRDYDFGGAAVITTTMMDGTPTDVVLAGQKSGHLWALNAETGEKLWDQRVGDGTPLGGNHWGIAIDDERAFLTINDPVSYGTQQPVPGVYAFNIADGEPVWSYEATPDCEGERNERVTLCDQKYGFSATPLVVDGAVIAGTLDGKLFVFDAETGDVLNVIDTAMPIETINGVEGNGGSIDSHAVNVGNGMLLIGSGYASFRQTPGNVLIALTPSE